MCAIERTPLRRPNWLLRKTWPFETLSLHTGGIRLAVTDVGTGPTLLFVHTGAWSFIWRDLIAQLSADFRCICFDAPGNGLSERIAPADTTLEGTSTATSQLIDALDLQRFTLVAHDLGGRSGLAAAGSMPGRVDGIVAMNTFAWKPDVRAFRGMLGLMGSAPIRRLDAITNFMGWIGSSSFGSGRHFDADSRRAFGNGSSASARAAFHYYMHSALHSNALYGRIQAALTGPLATVPVLTVFGERKRSVRISTTVEGAVPERQPDRRARRQSLSDV